MWKRKELKARAKEAIKRNYWTAVVICFLIALLTGEFSTSIIGVWQSEDSMDPNYIYNKNGIETNEIFSEENLRETLSDTQKNIFKAIEMNLNSATKSQKYIFKIWDAVNSFQIKQIGIGIILSIAAIIALAFTIFIADPLIVGGKRYFLKAREGKNTKIGEAIVIIQKGNWLNVSIIMWLFV